MLGVVAIATQYLLYIPKSPIKRIRTAYVMNREDVLAHRSLLADTARELSLRPNLMAKVIQMIAWTKCVPSVLHFSIRRVGRWGRDVVNCIMRVCFKRPHRDLSAPRSYFEAGLL